MVERGASSNLTVMRLLRAALILKIVLTICWCVSLYLPVDELVKLGMPKPNPEVFIRLLGAAFFALLLGYILGLRELQKGHLPLNTVLVGIISNGLACLTLIHFGFKGSWSEWGEISRYYMGASLLLTGLITALLVIGLIVIRRS